MKNTIIVWIPEIIGAGNISIKEGTQFNSMDGVTATYTENGDLTKDIRVTGTVDTVYLL